MTEGLPKHAFPHVPDLKTQYLWVGPAMYRQVSGASKIQLTAQGASGQQLRAALSYLPAYDFDDSGESAYFSWVVPHDFYPGASTFVKGIFINDGSSPAVKLALNYARLRIDSAAASATTAANTQWTAISGSHVDLKVRKTSSAVITRNTFSAGQPVIFETKMSSANTNGIGLFGLEIQYTQRYI